MGSAERRHSNGTITMKERTRAPAAQTATARAPQQRHVEHAGLTWLDVIEPTVAHVQYLRERYAFDPLALEDVLSHIQRPKLDSFAQGEYLFAVFHYPLSDKSQRVAGAAEVDIFVGHDYVITLHDGGLKPLRRLFTAVSSDEQARAQLMGRGSGYLFYRIVDALNKQSFPLLDHIDAAIARAEEHTYADDARQAIRDLADTRQDTVALRHTIAPNLAVARALEAGDHPFLRLNQASYFGDLADALTTIVDTLDEQRETIIGVRATLDSLAIQRTRESLRLLLAVALALLPMILVAAIFGMGLPLPFVNITYIFPIALVLMIGAAAGVIAFARYKQWI
jgi:magnesium transporter